MALLSLMTLMGLTLVLVTAQGRLSALAASRNSLQTEHDTEELTYARIQVIAGSADPNSSFGAHGLLEDLYGQPNFFGQIMPNTTGVPSVVPIGETAAGAGFLAGGNNGALLQLVVTSGNINTKTGASVGTFGAQPQAANQYVLPQNSGAFCGQVITMLTGRAAGQSARVVGYYYNAGAAATVPFAWMQVSSFGGIVPEAGDQFVINGRPFSGTGFGLNLAQFYGGAPGVWTAPTGVNIDTPLLSAIEAFPAPLVQADAQTPSGQYYAYMPNHAQIALSTFQTGIPGYWDKAGPGGANEPYDAPDFQNLMLAMHYYSPFLLPNTSPVGVITPIPSLHRPELVAWYYNQALISGNPGMAMGAPPGAPVATIQSMLAMRRKVILRPEPTDHYFVDTNGNNVWDAREPFHDVNGNGAYDVGDVYLDGTPAFIDLNGDGTWTPGEIDYSGKTFNPITGCWYIAANGGWALDTGAGLDVDNDKDGIPDSIWVDGGLPVHTESDGTLTKNLISVLVIDLDGKVNLNAHGTLAQLDQQRYINYPLSVGSVYGPVAGGAGSATLYGDAMFQRNAPVGQGYGPADVNPLHLFVRSHAPANLTAAGTPINAGSGTPTYTYSAGSTSGLANLASSWPLTYYKTFLQGYDYQSLLNGSNGIPATGLSIPMLQVDGRYGESARLNVTGFTYPGVFPVGSYNAASSLTYSQQLFNGPRAGWSQWFDPYNTSYLNANGYPGAYWVNDPGALARFSDIRPGLLTPPAYPTGFTGTPFFFDFLDSYLPGTATAAAVHVPTGHGTPSDLHSRGLLMTDLTGRPYYAGTGTAPWQTTGLFQPLTAPGAGWQAPSFMGYYSAVMTDSAASAYGVAAETVLNEGVDTQYEMDLNQNARQAGQNTGNTVSGIPDFASVDAKFSPSELEGLLRTFEQGTGTTADSAALLQRLNDLETGNSLSLTQRYSLLANKNTTSAAPPNMISPRNDIRLAVTTESLDLAMPNLALTPRQMQDVAQYVNYYEGLGTQFNWLANPQKMLNLSNIGLVDLMRARIYTDNCDPTTLLPAAASPLYSYITGGLSGTDTAIFGNLKNIQVTAGTTMPVAPYWPMLAPETILGMRLDVNRLLGNGMDDNLNGVVDEPLEVVQPAANGFGEALVYPSSQLVPGASGPVAQVNTAVVLPNGAKQNDMLGVLDLNNDGFYSTLTSGSTSLDPQTGVALPVDPTYADTRARQLLARHLYCLAMLVLDDRPYYSASATGYGTGQNSTQNILAQIFSTSGPATGTTTNYYNLMSSALPFPALTNTGTPYYNSNPIMPGVLSLANSTFGSREQAAYVIAQWAVNVVDFRDRDSIMTPFEFDLYPFRADDPANPLVTWNVDDIIDPFAGSLLPGSHNDDGQPWRGLVWGCERPELLMTETIAFHDRGTNDTTSAQDINDSAQNPSTGKDTLMQTGARPPATQTQAYDYDYDQVRRPRGSLIVELFNPTSYWDAPQADMQQPWQVPDANTNRGRGVNLAQVAAGQPVNNLTGPAASPVWRIVVAYSPWQSSESTCYSSAPTGALTPVGGGGYSNSPANASAYIDSRVPVLPPGAIHRVVYFTPYSPLFVAPAVATANAATPQLITVGDTLLNNSFFADPGVITTATAATLPPNAAAPNLLLPPGQYALVGPANRDPTTNAYNVYAGLNSAGGGNGSAWKAQLAMASASPPVAPNTSIAYLYSGSGGAFTLQAPYGPGYTGFTSTSTTVKPVIGVPIQTNWYTSYTPAGGAGATSQPTYVPHNEVSGTTPAGATINTTLRMSVSEPEHGYPVWYGGAITTATSNGVTPAQLWDDASYASAGFGPFPQHPFDSAQGTTSGGNYLQFGDLPNPYVAPGGSVATTLGYTVLYLQRLANPLQAWDQKMNPYITVDSMPVDLTAYTGETAASEPSTYYASSKSAQNVINSPSSPPTGYSNWQPQPGGNSSFDTRRRGYDVSGANTLLTDQGIPNIWSPLPTNSTNVFSSTTNFGAKYNTNSTLISPMPASDYCTLGYINWEYSSGSYYTASAAAMGTTPLNIALPAYMYNGDPMTQFPWLAWNNRPYVSQYELMLVPASSPSSQLQDFGMLGWSAAGTLTLNEFQPYQVGGATPPGQSQIVTPTANTLPAAQFMQLLNFFNNEQSTTATDTTNLLPNLYRIFEFLQVPSRYTGTQELLNPSQFAGDNAVSTYAGATANVVNAPVSHLFHTPFNWLPRYREPGRINLNTIFDPIVFKCLMDDYPGSLYANTTTDLNPVTGIADAMLFPRGLYDSMVQSRQGFFVDRFPNPTNTPPILPLRFYPYSMNSLGAPVPNASAPPNPVSQFAYNTSLAAPGVNSDIPTYFANPFRPDGSAAFVPPSDVPGAAGALVTYPWLSYWKLMHQWNYPAAGVNNSVNATLLRSQDFLYTAAPVGNSFPVYVNEPPPPPPVIPTATLPAPGPLALFDDTAFDTNNAGATYMNGLNTTGFRHAGRNATFEYQMFNRLGNTTTNRSNVYGIWITLGKFQVEAVAPTPTNPDGYKLVKPYLNAQGSQEVTRGFYIFDRSIPMGFQRGQDINIEKGLLVERVLETP